MSSSNEVPPASLQVLLDRIVSASNADDVQSSLQSLLESCQESSASSAASWILQHEDLPEHLCWMLQHQSLKTSSGDSHRTPLEEDVLVLILKLYQNTLVEDPTCLTKPEPNRCLEALLDVMDRSSVSVYVRVLSLQLLLKLSKKHKIAKEQWLQAPNGLYRLADTLVLDFENPMEEAVRQEALSVAHTLVRQSPAMAKVWVFAEVESKLLDATWTVYGGLTKGNVGVVQILEFILDLLRALDDASLHELIWQRPSVARRLTQLLDLRGGHEFLHPEEYVGKKKKSTTTKPSNKKQESKTRLGPLSSKRNQSSDDEDDLDSLLQSASSTQKKKTKSLTSDEPQQEQVEQETKTPDRVYPQLLEQEEKVIHLVLQIVHVLLQVEEFRPTVWKQYAPQVCFFIWEMALMVPPPANATRYQFALPSCQLQQEALELVATKIHSRELMEQLQGLDRLLHVVCTGGGLATALDERLKCSQAALAVLRRLLDASQIHPILMHTLAPPPQDLEGEEGVAPAAPPGPTVVQKLWNTVAEHLPTAFPTSDDADKPSTPRSISDDDETIFWTGALGGLTVFMVDAESREMLWQATPPRATLDNMLEALGSSTLAKDTTSQQNQIRLGALFRFLCFYMDQTPTLVQHILTSPASTPLATLATTSSPFQPLVWLLLGLSLEYFPASQEQCGGWTRTSLMEVLQTIGISKVTKGLEQFKTTQQNSAGSPSSQLEFETWQTWYQQAVWTVRKRMVQELAGGKLQDGDEDDDEEDRNAASSTSQSLRPMQKLIAQQTQELEDLRKELQQAQSQMVLQKNQLDVWQRRMQSNPTQLDTLLNELTDQTSVLKQEIADLKQSSALKEETHAQELERIKKQLEEQREEAARLQTESKEVQEDRDRMEQELSALSQAYSSLEEDYRKSSSAPASAPLGTPGGDAAKSSAKPTMLSPGGSSTEVATLRAENERMRENAKAADDWMKMAVDKMNEMGSQNAQLQQQVTSLQEQLFSAAGGNQEEENARLRGELDRVLAQELNYQEQLASFQQRVQEQEAETSALRQDLQHADEVWNQARAEWEHEKKDLQEQLQEANKVIVASVQSDATTKFHEEDASRVQELQEVLASKTAQIISLQEELAEAQQSQSRSSTGDDNATEVLQAELHAKTSRLEELEHALEEAQQGKGLDTQDEVERLQSELESKITQVQSLEAALEEAQQKLLSPTESSASPLHDEELIRQLEAARREVDEIRHRSDETIYKKESIIRELEDRLGSGLGPYNMEDIRTRDAEIEELRTANEAAQDWMSKAVEHNQMLQEKVSRLKEGNSKLAAQQEQGGVDSSHVDSAATRLLEEDLRQKTQQLEDIQAQLSARNEEYQHLSEKYEASQSYQEELGIAREEAQLLQKKLQKAQERATELEGLLGENSLYKENEELKSSVSDLEGRLQEFQTWADIAQEKIAELMAAKHQTDTLLKQKDTEIAALQAKVVEPKEEIQLPPETEADRSVVDQLRAEMDQLQHSHTELSQEHSQLQSDYQELQSLTEDAQQRIAEIVAAKEQLETEKQSWKDQLAGKNADFPSSPDNIGSEDIPETSSEAAPNTEEDNQCMAQKIERLEEEIRSKDVELVEYKEKVEANDDLVAQLSDKIDSLQSDIEILKSSAQTQEDESQQAIMHWQESHSEAEKRCHELEREIDGLKATTALTSEVHAVPVLAPKAEAVDAFSLFGASSPNDAADFFVSGPAGTVTKTTSNNIPADDTRDSDGDLLTRLRRTEEELEEAKKSLGNDEEVVRQWQERVEELEAEIDALQERSQEQEEEAKAAIAKWQEAHAEAESKCSALEEELEKANASTNSTKMEGEEADQSSEVALKMTRLQQELDAANEALESERDIVQQWENKISELEGTIRSLNSQIEEEQAEANSAIAQWQDSCNAAETKCEELEMQIAELLNSRNDPRSADGTQQAPSSPKTRALREDANILELTQKVASLEAEVSDLNRRQNETEETNDEMHGKIAELEAQRSALATELELLLEQKAELEGTKYDFGTAVQDATKVEELSRALNEKNEELKIATENLTENESLVEQWESRCNEMQSQLEEMRTGSEETINQWENRCVELESELESLESQNEQQQKQSKATIENLSEKGKILENRCAQLQQECDELRLRLSTSKEEAETLSSLREKVKELQNELEFAVSSKNTLESEIETLQGQKQALEEQLASALADSTHGYETRLQAQEIELTELREQIASDEAIVKQWKERVEELELREQELQEQLADQESEANNAIAQWQKTHSALEDKFSSLEENLESVHEELGRNAKKLADRDWTIEQLQQEIKSYQEQSELMNSVSVKEELEEELAVERGRHKEAREEIESLSRALKDTQLELEDLSNESKAVVGQWKETVEELECQLSAMQAQLSQQEAEANEAISSWELKAVELEDEVETIEAQKEQSAQAQIETERRLNDLQTRYEELVASEKEKEARLESTLKELDSLKAEHILLQEELSCQSREALQAERDRLAIVVTRMEEELNECSAMVQAHITDGSSDRAAEAAAQALRDGIEELQVQIRGYQAEAEEEAHKRRIAEQEIERLRDDIAAIVSLNEHENSSDEIQQRTAKAVERLKMKERIEIEQLRKSLYRSIEEVESARAAEKETNDKLSKIRLHTAISEQEIISAKSEINFLTQALEELRVNEEGKRASLEYRVGTLEDENDMLRRYHSSELETIRNELAQVSMEKDRVLHQLKESEKTNSQLILASSKSEMVDVEDDRDIELEVAKLRIENAHLLTVAADDKARAERRMREVLAAHRATAEADTILEHELRVAAESTIQSLKSQLEEYKRSGKADPGRDSEKESNAQSRLEALASEVDELRQELQSSKKENCALKAKMEQAARKAKSEIAALTEECRQAQAKFHKYEREGRFDAAVQSEVAKLRITNSESRSPYRPTFGDSDDEDPATMRVDPHQLVGAESFDLIRRQREEIEEERQIYREFLAEHDDLLALLAQNDIERDHLKRALTELAGKDTLDSVLKEVQEKTMEEFGNVINVA